MRYHDNGQLAFDGKYLVSDRNTRLAAGIHKTYYATGRLSGERHYDARGKVSRERIFDEAGTVIRDDELFEDGSRKAFSR
jgi:antitoxin component YwqK of YwqJK toxin-antitoxin module